ncbi:4-hydroxy-tetrahydrodipicolinate synthase [Massilioclostridium coli]|uniref:4-hydroxy-tetrahydrodipicolinate synthase n=1 Tax=Massilioclostridium coli TaxID=1870991 RepID=UPI0022E5F9B2|nr:4-hydroxy-tetrahydrodipicolinate synthase [Massilioclostridium coli]
MSKKTIFKGSGVALITPMNLDGTVNYETLDELLEFQIENKTDAIVITGTTGEASTLSDKEHIDVIEHTVQKVNHRIPVIAGTGSNNTAHAIELSRQAEQVGADAVLLVTPYYNKASQEGLYLHFKACAEAISIPVILYNVPSRTGVNIMPLTYLRLSKIPNIVAVKEASGNFSQIAKTVSLCGDQLDVYSGNDDQITSALALGAKGVISVLANVVPEDTHQICQSYFNGDTVESDTLQLYYLELIENLFSDVNPIPVKQAMNFMGYNAGKCRLPLCDMDDVSKEKLLACMQRYELVEPKRKVGSVTVRRPQFSMMRRMIEH